MENRNNARTPLITPSALDRLFIRHVPIVCPESRLVVATIKQAIFDLQSSSKDIHAEAMRFFEDGRLETWCDFADINPEFVREIVVKAKYMPEILE